MELLQKGLPFHDPHVVHFTEGDAMMKDVL